jgi:hypothetical protein
MGFATFAAARSSRAKLGSLKPAHEKCHDRLTHEIEAPMRAKENRVFDKHFGIKKARRGRPMPGSKASGMKKGFDRRVTDRRTGHELGHRAE